MVINGCIVTGLQATMEVKPLHSRGWEVNKLAPGKPDSRKRPV